jgi:hypothetical protein
MMEKAVPARCGNGFFMGIGASVQAGIQVGLCALGLEQARQRRDQLIDVPIFGAP